MRRGWRKLMPVHSFSARERELHTIVMLMIKSPKAHVPRTASDTLKAAQHPGSPNHTHPLALYTEK
jgi:hypothetical protein